MFAGINRGGALRSCQANLQKKAQPMFSPKDFLASVAHETNVILHLAKKIDPGQLDYRLGEGIRTSLELLQYLTHCGSTPLVCLVEGDWAIASQRGEKTKSVTLENFEAAMKAQLQEMEAAIGGMSEQDFAREVALPWGVQQPLGAALVDTSLKFLASYRFQLFLHAKAAGKPDLSTMNAWLGMDRPQG